MTADTVKFHRDDAGDWRWTKTASNGRIVGASTEGYKRKADCWNNFVREVMTAWVVVDENGKPITLESIGD